MNEQGEFFSKLLESGLGLVWFLFLALWGGTVNYLKRIKEGKVEVFSFFELVGEWAISGFAGILTALICLEAGFSWQMTAFFTGVSGHLGGKVIDIFESYVRRHYPGIDSKCHSNKKDKNDDE